MRSPFQIFRKHQKVALAIILIMIMFAFTVEQAVSRLSTGDLPVAVSVGMAAMLGALIGAVIGIQTGKPKEYAAAGVLICAVVALVVFGFGNRGAAAVDTNVGNLSTQKLQELINRRRAANNFVEAVFYKTMGDKANIFTQRILQQKLFGFGVSPTPEADAILTFLCEHEADRMGIEVSDEAVNDFIKSISPARELSVPEFNDIRKSMRVSETQLYDWLRAEIGARTAFFMGLPRFLPTPEDYWDIYRKLHVDQSLEVAALPVEAFTASVPDPTEKEIAELYEQFAQVEPNRLGPGKPGFLQPRKISVAYFETKYDEILAAQQPVTDQEVEEFYNKNKEMFRNRQFPETFDTGPTRNRPGTESGPELKQRPDEDPAFDPTATPKTSPDAKKPGNPETETKGTAPDAPNPEPAKKAESEDKPAASNPPKAESKNDTPKKDEPKSDSKSDAKPNGSSRYLPAGNRRGRLDAAPSSDYEAGTLLALADETPAAEKSAADKRTDGNKAPVKSEPKPAAPAEPAATKPAPTDAKSAGAPKGAAPAEPPAQESKDDADAPVEAPKPLPEFRPLDDTVRAEIRNILVEQRARAAIKTAVDEIVNKVMFPLMDKYDPATKMAEELLLKNDKKKPASPEQIAAAEQATNEAKEKVNQALAQYAAEKKLSPKITELLTYEELGEATHHSIGLLVDPLDMSSGAPGNTTTVRDRLFGSRPEDIYRPVIAEDELTKNRFALWKIDDVDSHVPNLTDPGIREQVIAAYKHMKAQPLAEKRANELADLVRESKKGVAAFLTGQTVTGAEGSPALVTKITPRFSWLAQSTAPPTGLFEPNVPQVSEITAIDEPSPQAREALMRVVFDDMKNGEIHTVSNSTRTYYYVVQVYDRHPDTPEALEAQKNAFLRENLFAADSFLGGPATGYSYLLGDKQQMLIRQWVNDLNNKYEVQVRMESKADEFE